MKVFLAGTSFQHAYGGPARSVSRLATALADTGIQVGLWAPDQSAVTTPFISADSSVQRLIGTEAEALGRFGQPDILHDNGIWLRHNHRLAHLAKAMGIPRVVSTRGMLEPWALNHKRLKKRLAWWLYQRRDLKAACSHHTTADPEAGHVRELNLGVPLKMIPNGVDVPAGGCFASDLAGGRRDGTMKTALFLGRLYPVKGVPMLVEAWSRVRPAGWRLKIAGPDEQGHKVEVEQAVRVAGLQDVVTFTGPVDDDAKRLLFRDADLFVLPTHSESFGMAIGEALAHGLPVLTTTAAPWPSLQDRGCGWSASPTVDSIAETLRHATSLDSVTLQAMGAKGCEWVASEFGWDRVAEQFVTLYQSCTS